MTSLDHYRIKRERGARWLEQIQAEDRIFIGSAAGEPITLVDALARAISAGAVPTSICCYQMGARKDLNALLDAAQAGPTSKPRATFYPNSIYQMSQAFEGRFEVALLQVTPPDALGHVSLGISVDFAAQVARGSRFVVAEVNEKLPRTLGDAFLQFDEIDALVEATHDIEEVPSDNPDAESRAVAAHVASLVPDGATIEIGIGSVAAAVLGQLRGHRRLGLHTGLIVDEMIDLIECGAVTNEEKGIDLGASVANQARGTRRLYAFLHENPLVSFRPASYTHDPAVLGRLRAFRAINSALEVDLLGQVNCEYIGGVRTALPGGLPDFVRAAHAAPGARSIIALRSTGRRGSRVVPRLQQGVTLTADWADVIVTEHGVAELRGLDAAARAEAMVRIANPSAREALERAIPDVLARRTRH